MGSTLFSSSLNTDQSMKNDIKLGRFVQCRCSHTCLPDSIHGFQWLLPRTKSKHMLYQQIQQKNNQQQQDKASNTSVELLEQQLSSFSLLKQHDKTSSKKSRSFKHKRTFRIPILLETELKRKVANNGNENVVLKEFFVKTSYN